MCAFSTMLFRAASGNLVDIRRSSYASDTAYHKAVMRVRGIEVKSAQNIVAEIQHLIRKQR